MSYFLKRILLPLFLVSLFFLLFYPAADWILESFPYHFRLGLDPLLELDSGRLAGRLFRFLWAILLFYLFERLIHKRKLHDTVLFRPAHKFRTFFWGAFFGGFLVLSLIVLSVATKTVIIRAVHLFPGEIISVTALYLICMALTAIAEEIVMRGYIVETLKENWGTHWAVWISAIAFGLVNLGESYHYAYTAFLGALFLGYAYAWYGIYYTIGFHFMWDFLESFFYSNKIFIYKVNDSFLVGNKMITPDEEGFLVLPILLIGFAILLAVHKTEWRLTEKN